MQEKNQLSRLFAKRFSEAIRQSGLTQKELASIVNITEQTLSKYKKGNRVPDSEELFRLAKFFGVTMDWLLGADESTAESAWKQRALDAEQKLASTHNAILLLEKAKDILDKAISSG